MPVPPSADALASLHERFSRMAPLPDAEWDAFRAKLVEVSVARGTEILAVGDAAVPCFHIVSGLVKASYLVADGEEYVRNFAWEGQFIAPYGAALRNVPSNVSIVALEPVRALRVLYADFKAMFARHPCWQEIGRKLAESYYIIREKHAFDLLTLDALNRYRAFLEDYPGVAARIPRKDVASYLGITAVSLSRLSAKKAKAAP